MLHTLIKIIVAMFLCLGMGILLIRKIAGSVLMLRRGLKRLEPKDRPYKIGVYFDGDLAEVFAQSVKDYLQKYKMPVVVVPLHELASRLLLYEYEWRNGIAKPDGEAVDLVVVGTCHIIGKRRYYLEMCCYHPNGAEASYRKSDKDQFSSRLARKATVGIMNDLLQTMKHPAEDPGYDSRADNWPFDRDDIKPASAE